MSFGRPGGAPAPQIAQAALAPNPGPAGAVTLPDATALRRTLALSASWHDEPSPHLPTEVVQALESELPKVICLPPSRLVLGPASPAGGKVLIAVSLAGAACDELPGQQIGIEPGMRFGSPGQIGFGRAPIGRYLSCRLPLARVGRESSLFWSRLNRVTPVTIPVTLRTEESRRKLRMIVVAHAVGGAGFGMNFGSAGKQVES